jgi:hypothetical protein
MLQTFSCYSEFKIDGYSEPIPIVKNLLLISAIGKLFYERPQVCPPNSAGIRHASAPFETAPDRGYELQFF